MIVSASQNFRFNVAAACEAEGISQGRLAERSGLSRPYINRILGGHSVPSIDCCEKIAQALDIPLESLVMHPSEFSAKTA